MSTLEKIENELLTNSANGELAASTFREILGVLSFDESISGQLDSTLQSVETLLPIAESFDHKYTNVWPRWAVTIRQIREILKNQIPENAIHKNEKPANPWRGKLGKYPLITCLITPIESAALSGGTPAKAILLIRSYGRTRNDGTFLTGYSDFEKFLADSIRKSCSRPADHLWRFVPPWTSTANAEWRNSFLHSTRYFKPLTSRFAHPSRFYFHVILSLKKTLELVSGDDDSNTKGSHPPPAAMHTPPQERSQSVVFQPPDIHEKDQTTKKRAKRSAFSYIYEQPTAPISDTEGLAPVSVHATSQAETSSDQPTLPSSVQSLEVRYTNYRTAMDNQRLPWDWDCLNFFEIDALLAALQVSSGKYDSPSWEKQGALIVWLMLATGQSIEKILSFTLGQNQVGRHALIPGPIYVRSILPPPHSFHPSLKQQTHLTNHESSIELALPAPFPSLLIELGLINSNVTHISQKQSLGICLNVDKHAAELAARQFLENQRTRNLRLLPGRIRNALSREIMQITNDPVITHLLTSLPTDLPPTGVYYTSYPKEHLTSVYSEAIAVMFKRKK